GRPLSHTAAGRLVLLLAEVAAKGAAPVALMALAMHPLVHGGIDRREWLAQARIVERELRGPRPREGLEPLDDLVAKLGKHARGLAEWWSALRSALVPLFESAGAEPLADLLDRLAIAGEALCGDSLWAREDGRALARFIEDLRFHARAAET